MYNALKARLFQGYRTGSFPDAPPSLPDRFTGRPVISAACTGCGSCQEVCPVEAVEIRDGKAVVDTGK